MTDTAPARSEVSFELENGSQRGLRFDFNTIVEVEEALGGKAFTQLAAQLASGLVSFRDLRVLAQKGLNSYALQHGSKKKVVSLAEAGDIVQELGLQQFTELMQTAIVSAFPEAGEDDEASESVEEGK